jgi:hypothetical protein
LVLESAFAGHRAKCNPRGRTCPEAIVPGRRKNDHHNNAMRRLGRRLDDFADGCPARRALLITKVDDLRATSKQERLSPIFWSAFDCKNPLLHGRFALNYDALDLVFFPLKRGG